MAYRVIEHIDCGKKQILEVGPRIIRHLRYIKNKPNRYAICDINEDVLNISERQLKKAQISCDNILLDQQGVGMAGIPFPEKSFDIVISFNSLEHLYPLDDYIMEIKRILKKEGRLIGGIPCEGGLHGELADFSQPGGMCIKIMASTTIKSSAGSTLILRTLLLSGWIHILRENILNFIPSFGCR